MCTLISVVKCRVPFLIYLLLIYACHTHFKTFINSFFSVMIISTFCINLYKIIFQSFLIYFPFQPNITKLHRYKLQILISNSIAKSFHLLPLI